MKKFEVRISYNPYETEVILMSENKKYDRNHHLHRKPFKELLIIASEKFDNLIQGKDQIHCIFEGRNYEYNLTKSKIESEYKKSSKEISFEHICKYEYNIKEIEEQVKQLPDDLFDNASKKQEILRQLHSNIEIYIIGLYSSGKSTFINSMIGESVLYTHSDVATNKLFRIIDNDKNIIEMQTSKDKKQISNKKYQDASAVAAILQELNNDKRIDTITLEIDIPNIDSSHFKLELIDTPGVNNAENTLHQSMVYDAINNKENTFPPIILVLNANNFKSNDQDELFDNLLEAIQKVQKDSSEIKLERFFFIINRADEIPSKEYEANYEKIKKLLERKIGDGTKIYSANAEYALLIRKKLKSINLDTEDEDKLETFIRRISKNIIKFLPEYSTRSTLTEPVVLDESDSEEEKLQKALQYTGIPMIEEALQEYLTNHAIVQKMEYTFKSLAKIVNFQKSKSDGFTKDLQQAQDRIKSLTSDTKTEEEKIEVLKNVQEKLTNNKINISDKKKALETFADNMEPALKKYQEEILKLHIDDSKLADLNEKWVKYVNQLSTLEENKKYSNQESVNKRSKILELNMNNKKEAIYSELNVNMRQTLRTQASAIVEKFYEVIDDNINILGEEDSENLKKEIKVKFNDKEEILAQSNIYTTKRDIDLWDWFIIPRLFGDNYKINLESFQKESIKFKNKLDLLMEKTLTELTHLKFASIRSIQKEEKMNEILSDLRNKMGDRATDIFNKKLQNRLMVGQNNIDKFEEIIAAKKVELQKSEEEIEISSNSLYEIGESLKKGEDYSVSLEKEQQSLKEKIQDLEDQVNNSKSIVTQLENLLNKQDIS
jgi:signal recognition particle receptor subunit beta